MIKIKEDTKKIHLKLLCWDRDTQEIALTKKGEETWLKAFPTHLDDMETSFCTGPNLRDAGFPDSLNELGESAANLRRAAKEMNKAAEDLEKVDALFESEMKIAEHWMKTA